MLCFLILVLTLFYLVQRYIYSYWKRRNVPGPKPRFIVGNLGENFLSKKSINDIYIDIYKKYRDHPFVGVYRMGTPCLLAIDPDLVKQVTVTNFRHFHDNDMYIDKKADPIFGRNPFVLKGEEWKEARNILTPCFTSGKMKLIFPLINDVGKNMVKYVNEQINNDNMPLECKKLCTKFTLDNVGTCAFGLDGKCFVEPHSDFQDLADRFFAVGTWQSVKFTLISLFPWLNTCLNVGVVSADVDQELRKMVQDTIEYRQKNNIERLDFLHMMNQLRFTNPDFTMEDVVAQAAGFFGDGYETSSIVMSFLLYALACNPDIQEKLRQEIQDKLEENKGSLTYEAVAEMEYLDACLNESQRKYPVAGAILKTCTDTFTYTPTDTKEFKSISVTIEKGTSVILPRGGFVKDPTYFYEPEEYIPERFLKESKEQDRSKGVHKPFGEGPRACLGQRFGVLQIKIGIIYLINNFKFTFNGKTQTPLKFDPWYIMLSPIGGLWINVEKLT